MTLYQRTKKFILQGLDDNGDVLNGDIATIVGTHLAVASFSECKEGDAAVYQFLGQDIQPQKFIVVEIRDPVIVLWCRVAMESPIVETGHEGMEYLLLGCPAPYFKIACDGGVISRFYGPRSRMFIGRSSSDEGNEGGGAFSLATGALIGICTEISRVHDKMTTQELRGSPRTHFISGSEIRELSSLVEIRLEHIAANF